LGYLFIYKWMNPEDSHNNVHTKFFHKIKNHVLISMITFAYAACQTACNIG